MANIAIFRINYKSDFILTLNSDAGWMTPFCIKFWTGAPSQAYFAGFDGTTYTNCAPVAGEPTKLLVQFDDHHLPIGDLKFQIGYHFTVADFPNDTEDEVLNHASVIIEVDDAPAQVMLDFNGETAPEIEFSLPAYANEAQRIANEEQRIAAEQQRIANEDARIQAEETRQQNEQQRIQHEEYRVSEFARMKSESEAATTAANAAATLANEKAQLAADKAALANYAATLANQKAQLAADKAALANAAAQLANEKAALAQQKAEYAQQQGGYAKDQGDYAKNQGDYAKEQGDTALADHQRAEADHGIAVDDHTQAGNDHTRAESDHGIAVDDHTQAGNDHTRAESDHGIAADDHTQAGNDHTRAESDHGIAADDNTQAGNDHTRAESDHTRAESDHAAVEPFVDSLGAFDISAYHATGGVLAKYADLTAALGTNGANIPEALRKGGMSVKYAQSSDNKYVQFRYMGTSTANVDFANVANWQLSDEVISNDGLDVDFAITDFNKKAVLVVQDGHIKTKNFDSSKTLTADEAPTLKNDDDMDFAIKDEQNHAVLSVEDGYIKTKNFDSKKALTPDKAPVSKNKDNRDGDFIFEDANKNVVMAVQDGHLITKNFNSRKSDEKTLKIFFIGNSITQDHVGYLPYLLDTLYKNKINFVIANYYVGGMTIRGYVDNYINGNESGLYSYAKNTPVWTQEEDVYLPDAITRENWDIISIQAYPTKDTGEIAEDLTKVPIFVKWLRDNSPTPFELAYLIHQYMRDTSTYVSYHRKVVNAAKTIIEQNQVSMLFGPYFCIREAMNFFDVDDELSPHGDGLHLREGLPVLLTGMHLMDVICKRFGILSKINGNKITMPTALWRTLNIPGTNGTPDDSFGTDRNYYTAQYCAIQGTKETEAFYQECIKEMVDNIIV